MRFRDVPKFPHSAWQADMAWNYFPIWINEEMKTMGLQLNPDFQRGHVWTTEQQTAYLEYVIKGGRSGLDIYFNHPNWMGSFEGEFVCVDGLQRITAVLDFMNNKIPAFGHLKSKFTDEPRMTECRLHAHIACLQTRAEVLQWYLDFNSAGTIHTSEELGRVRVMLQKEQP